MNALIVVLIFNAFLYSSAQPYVCGGPSDPCSLDNVNYTPLKGYQCIQMDPTNVACTCPGAYELNAPCRLCARSNPLNNVCSNKTGKLLACIETTEFGTSYACLCTVTPSNAALTTDADCDTIVTLSTRPTTTTVSSGASSQCVNGGVFFNNICNCPSGFAGTLCEQRNTINLCDKIYCKNNGVCAARDSAQPYGSVCLCRYGTWGDYCEINGTLGFCSASSCMNGGACRENLIASTRHAYCFCQAGYNGVKCENRYFTCPSAGKFVDVTMFDQGKYFECTVVGASLRLEQRSCPKGLRFNPNAQICTY